MSALPYLSPESFEWVRADLTKLLPATRDNQLIDFGYSRDNQLILSIVHSLVPKLIKDECMWFHSLF
jgi:hypothetical protein